MQLSAAVLAKSCNTTCDYGNIKWRGVSRFLFITQVLLAVLARGYDWQVDLNEPVKTFPLPVPAHGLPMTFQKL